MRRSWVSSLTCVDILTGETASRRRRAAPRRRRRRGAARTAAGGHRVSTGRSSARVAAAASSSASAATRRGDVDGHLFMPSNFCSIEAPAQVLERGDLGIGRRRRMDGASASVHGRA